MAAAKTFSSGELGDGNAGEQNIFFFVRQRGAGIRDLQRRHVRMESFFRLELQQARRVRLRQRRQFRLRRQNQFQRHAEHAVAFADADGIQVVADFASDQFRRGGQRVQRERGGKSLERLQ
ncbi:MAG: hypothetical protein WCJ07_03110 [Verrucomicrobiota bacterium]